MRFPLLLSTLILVLTAFVSADTVTLVSGEKIEGKILSETDTEVTVEVAAGGVVEERVIKKSEIATTSKQPPDEVAWQTLKTIKLGNDSLPSVQQYDTYTAPLRSFTTRFADSKHKADAEKLLAEFEAEKKRVADGELKLAGKWMSKEEVQKERYQISALLAANFMREQSRRDPIGALNTFDVIEKQYSGSRAWIDAVPVAANLAALAKQQADTRLTALQTEIAERDKAVKASNPTTKKQLEAEIDRRDKIDRDQLDAASKQNLKWPPYIPTSLESLKRISGLAESEVRRLKNVDLAKPRESVKFAEEAKVALAKKEFEKAEELYRKSRDAWGSNDMLKAIDTGITEGKTAAAAAPPPEEKPAEKPAESTTAKTESNAAESSEAATSDAEVEKQPLLTPPRIVIGIIVLGLAIAGWKAYKSVKSKSNEVIE